MDISDGLAALLKELHAIHAKDGEEAWKSACKSYAREFLKQGPKGAEFAEIAFKDVVDLNELRREIEVEASTTPPPVVPPVGLPTLEEAEQMMIAVMRVQLPQLRTQAQFNTFMACFEALRMTANGIFERDPEKASKGRAALNNALDALEGVTDVSERLRNVPEAATSKASEDFKNPPMQFGVAELYRRLIGELTAITDKDVLSAWWNSNRADIDKLTDPKMRNSVIDMVREKKNEL